MLPVWTIEIPRSLMAGIGLERWPSDNFAVGMMSPRASDSLLSAVLSRRFVAAAGGGTRFVVAPKNLRGYRGMSLDAYGALLQGGPDTMPQVLAAPRGAWRAGRADRRRSLAEDPPHPLRRGTLRRTSRNAPKGPHRIHH